MRLEPIEKPRGLMSRIAYYMGKRQFGKVPAAFKVIYARSPKLGMASYQIARIMEKGLAHRHRQLLQPDGAAAPDRIRRSHLAGPGEKAS